jgi:ankyrin repeat protein
MPRSHRMRRALVLTGCIVAALALALYLLWFLLLFGIPYVASRGLPALHQAAEAGDVQRVRLLLKLGVPVNCKGVDNITALICAARRDRIDAAGYLIVHGADVNAAEVPFGYRPLSGAAQVGDLALVRLLVEAGAEVNYTGAGGGTPLQIAANRDWPEVVAFLLAHGADPNLPDGSGMTPAFEATAGVLRMLVKAGARVNVRDSRGFTPLHLQARYGEASAVEVLLQNGADVNARDARGRTPIEVAEENESEPGHKEVIALLRARGGVK